MRGIQLADPSYLDSGRIDFIIGADLYPAILRDEMVRGPIDAPVAQNTILGWIVAGAVGHPSQARVPQTLLKFWEIEHVPQIQSLTPEEEYCETYYQSTVTRKEDGRFVVCLPFSKQELLPDSRDIAISRLLHSERKLARNRLLEMAYKNFIHQYLALFHMELAPPLPANNLNYYLSHHAVCPQNSSKKIRGVFNILLTYFSTDSLSASLIEIT